jgi:hypothetical protein
VGERLKNERPQSIRAAVNWAVLGLVIERPSYGYELWRRFERHWGDVIDVSGAPSIYSALNQLKESVSSRRWRLDAGSPPAASQRRGIAPPRLASWLMRRG